MRTFFLCCCLLLFASLTAQQSGNRVVDLVHLRSGKPVEGTILEYRYGDRVLLIDEAGNELKFTWEEIVRVNFRVVKGHSVSVRTEGSEAVTPTLPLFEEEGKRSFPQRKFRHQVSGHLGFSTAANTGRFGGNLTNFGGGIAYHYLRTVSRFQLGLGLDFALMSSSRQENALALTALGEYRLNRADAKISPLVRLEIGPSIPVGALDDNFDITSRSAGLLWHPSVGLTFNQRDNQWAVLVIDLGYRFLDTSFIITTDNLDVIERNVQYRRLVLRGALRF